MKDLLSRHLLHWMESNPGNIAQADFAKIKEDIIKWILDKAPSSPSSTVSTWQAEVFCHPIIPLPLVNKQRRYRCLKGMVDPDTKLGEMYLEEEDVFPCSETSLTHRWKLRIYGLAVEPTWDRIVERIRYFAERWEIVDLDRSIVENILDTPVKKPSSSSDATVMQIRSAKWLPARAVSGDDTTMAPDSCRNVEDARVIDLVLGVSDLTIKPNWKRILGWDQPIDSDILLQQLDECLLRKDFPKARQVLLYMNTHDRYSVSDLRKRACLPGRSGTYYTPTKLFRPDSELASWPLAPYLDEVDTNFASDIAPLVAALKIPANPSLSDLQEVQTTIVDNTEDVLAKQDLSIAIATLEIAVLLDYDTTDLLIPDTTCRLRSLKDIVRGDPLLIGANVGYNFTHPRVSADLAERLSVENASARAINLEIEDDIDFTPGESLQTVITDTLDRYPIAATFNEFLANADDAKATKIVWTLDECNEGPYPSNALLTRELHAFQGSALMVYNDGSMQTLPSRSCAVANCPQSSQKRTLPGSKILAREANKEMHPLLECSVSFPTSIKQNAALLCFRAFMEKE